MMSSSMTSGSEEEGTKFIISSSLVLPTLDDTIPSDPYYKTEEYEKVMEV